MICADMHCSATPISCCLSVLTSYISSHHISVFSRDKRDSCTGKDSTYLLKGNTSCKQKSQLSLLIVPQILTPLHQCLMLCSFKKRRCCYKPNKVTGQYLKPKLIFSSMKILSISYVRTRDVEGKILLCKDRCKKLQIHFHGYNLLKYQCKVVISNNL